MLALRFWAVEPLHDSLNGLFGRLGHSFSIVATVITNEDRAMKKNAIGILLALTFSAAAQANSFSNDYFTITYDDSFWDGANISWNAKTGTLSFGGLVNQWGLVASTTSRRDLEKTDSTGKNWWGDMLTVTSKSGYVLNSVETGIRGVTTASANVDAGNGNFAYAYAGVQSDWTLGGGQYAWSWAGANAAASKVSSDGGNYSVSGAANFSSGGSVGEGAALMSEHAALIAGTGATKATLNSLWAGVSANTYGTGSAARASINQMSFTVVTAPVPEPETYAMFLAGLGVIGAVARRRKQA